MCPREVWIKAASTFDFHVACFTFHFSSQLSLHLCQSAALFIPINFAVCALFLPKLPFVDQFKLGFATAYNPVLRGCQWTIRWMGEESLCSSVGAVN